MPNFANTNAMAKASRMIASTISLEQEAQNIARNSKRNPNEFMLGGQIDPRIIQSMTDQGMNNEGNLGPGSPISPMNQPGTEPRQFSYTIGQNIVQRPRSTERVSFDTMKNIIDMYDIAMMCIEVRLDELRNLDWDIVPLDEDEADKYESEIRQVRAFFEKPDGNMLFDDFQNMIAYDWLAYDALTIYPHLTKGGKLGALEVVDGKTITPMVDYYGRTPQAPAPAYLQWMYGMPWTWLSQDQLIYRPFNRTAGSLYGRSPVEWLLNTINTDIRYQLYFLQYFTDGSIPDTWINAPENMADPSQIKSFQSMYDAVMRGDQTQKHKALFIPFGSKVQQAKDVKFDINFPQFMLNKTCAAFKVTPAELGFTENVNKSSGESQENVHYRRSIKPSAQFFQRIYTGIIHKYFGYTNLKFKFLNIEEQEDRLLMAQSDQIYIQTGVVSPDEVRVARYGFDVDLNNPVPRMFISSRTIMPVSQALEQADLSIKQLEAQIDQEEAQAQSLGATNTLLNPSDNDDSITDTEEEMDAQKAHIDFFQKAPTGKNKRKP